ncbi:MAG: GatB/YqeY domain-containing protein [Odoribacteraceae bacterium]|jgi:uncharacterized protein YqeY|nr:GatB/YqeY domain-containing protein [Odoribacteraceae bacterium]
MTIEEKVNKGIMEAMKARETLRLEVLRNIKKVFIEAKAAPGASASLSDAECVKIIGKLAKQGRDAAAIFLQQGRTDLYDHESAQVAVLEEFLPRQLNEEELIAALKAIIEQVGATSAQDTGKVMSVATRALAGTADGKIIAVKVKELLG